MPRVKRYEEAVPVLEAELLEAIERDRMAARALDLEAAQRIQDIRRQAAATQGFDAETAAAGARKAIAETRAEFAGRATSPRMRAMLEDVLERRAALVDDELTAHTERARTAALIDGALQRRQLARQDALDAITPHAFDIHHQTMLDAIDEHGRLVGLDPAEIAANRLRASSAVHADRTAARLDAGDVDGAIAWRDANRDAFSAADLARLEALLAEPAARAASATRVDRVMGALTRDANLPFSYADPLHGAGRTAIPDEDGTTLAIPATEGLPVYPTAPGIARRDGDGAMTIAHADGSTTRYSGLADLRLQDGEQVTPDTQIGTVAADTNSQLRYQMWRGDLPLGGAALSETVTAAPGGAKLATMLDAIENDPDPSYSSIDRQHDQAALIQRVAMLTRPSANTLSDAILSDPWPGADQDPVLEPGFDNPALFDDGDSPAITASDTGTSAADGSAIAPLVQIEDGSIRLGGPLARAFRVQSHGNRQASGAGVRQGKPGVAPAAPKAPDPESVTRVTPGSTLPDFPRVGQPPAGDGSGAFASERPTRESLAFKQTMLQRAARADSWGLHNAARHVRHFLGASGAPLTPDTRALLASDHATHQGLMGIVRQQLLPFARAGMRKVTADKGTFRISTPWKQVTALSPDWYAALGTFSISVSSLVTYRKQPNGIYYFEVASKMNVYDRYNWDAGKRDAYYYWGVDDEQMASLHRQGEGQDFEVRGRTDIDTYRFTYDPRTGKIVPRRPHLRRPATIEPG